MGATTALCQLRDIAQQIVDPVMQAECNGPTAHEGEYLANSSHFFECGLPCSVIWIYLLRFDFSSRDLPHVCTVEAKRLAS